MEVRIGVIHTGKEVRIDTETSADDLVTAIDEALSGARPVLWLTDKSGDRHAVPSDKIAWVELELGTSSKRVGFGPG